MGPLEYLKPTSLSYQGISIMTKFEVCTVGIYETMRKFPNLAIKSLVKWKRNFSTIMICILVLEELFEVLLDRSQVMEI